MTAYDLHSTTAGLMAADYLYVFSESAGARESACQSNKHGRLDGKAPPAGFTG